MWPNRLPPGDSTGERRAPVSGFGRQVLSVYCSDDAFDAALLLLAGLVGVLAQFLTAPLAPSA
jgi:hypothetical protein